MNLNLLEQITRLMRDNDLNTVDVRDGNKRVILKRGAMSPSAGSGFVLTPQFAPSATTTTTTAAHPGLPSGAVSPSGAGSSASAASGDESGQVAIKSPMVGTFYSASSPDAKPFVSVGSQVDEETDVCIIEAMKVFNNIKAEMKGTIAKVLVSNGQTVEFGQSLFLVKPA
jgi:acetyl-CoA carboxylase biotin carboxyl carrier protein